MKRRDFVKGAAALIGTLSMNWGGRTITAEEDAMSDAVVQDGVDRGLYSQELANEIINFSALEGDVALETAENTVAEGDLALESSDSVDLPKLVDSPKDIDPTEVLLEFNWSKALDALLDDGIEVHCHSCTAQHGDVICRPISPALRIMHLGDDQVFDQPVEVEQLLLEQFYVSFLIKDYDSNRSIQDICDLYLNPGLHSIARELNAAAKAKDGHLWMAKLPVMNHARSFGVKQRLSDEGRVPVRISMEYDVACQGTRVSFDFLAHYPE